VQNSAAFGAYTFNNNATGATPDEKNVVGFFVVGVNGVDGARTWGINTSCNDSTPNGLATLNNRVCVGYEVDFTANGASTFEGIPLIIQGPGTPASASAIHVSIVPSSTAKWTNGFIVDNGALVSNGLGAIFGAKSVSGANVASVPVQFTTYDSSGVAHGLTISSIPLTTNVGLSVIDNVLANGIVLQMGAAGAPAGILAQGSDTNINLDIFPKGTGSIILNTGVTLTSVSTSAGTGTYSVCASATGALFLKTSAGACL
jgi:hypothetical protein